MKTIKISHYVIVVLFATMLTACSSVPSEEGANPEAVVFPGQTMEVTGSAKNVSEITHLAPTDFPWWRGLSRCDTYPAGTKAPLSWSEEEHIGWKVPLPGLGHGTPTIVGDAIFVGTGIESKDDKNIIEIAILKIDRKTGKILKQETLYTGKKPGQFHRDNSHASTTIASDGKRLFFPFMLDDTVWFYCCDMNLNTLWKKELGEFNSIWGFSTSPLIYKNLVIVVFDPLMPTPGYLIAFDRESGEVVWKINRGANKGGFSSPNIVPTAGRDQLLVCGPEHTIAYNPDNGSYLWSIPGPSDVIPSGPIWDEKNIYISSGWPQKHLVRVEMTGLGDLTDSVRWDNRKDPIPSYVPSLVLKDNLLYVLSDPGTMSCLNPKDGKLLWIDELEENFYSSPCIVGDYLYIFGRAGGAWIYKLGNTLERIAENRLDSGVWTTPIFLDDGIYLRTVDSLYFIR